MKFILILQCLYIISVKANNMTHKDKSGNSNTDLRYGNVNNKGKILSMFATTAAMQQGGRNLVCSPISVLMPIGKLALGVSNSRHAIYDSLGVEDFNVKSYFNNLISKLKRCDGIVLHIASRLYLSNDKKIYAKFVNDAKEAFGSAYEFLDFKNPTGSARIINDWVSKNTDGIINNIIDSSNIKSSSSVIIINAIYFLGRWKKTFKSVYKGDFYSPRGKKQVDMMYIKHNYEVVYAKNLEASIIKIPYTSDDAYMAVILPSETQGLPKVLKALNRSPDMLNYWLKRTEKSRVSLELPKFTIESTLNLGGLYQSMGLSSIFGSHSGIDRIVQGEHVSVSAAIHKAYIDVDAKYTEAAAATAVVVPISFDPDLVSFVADHPFLFYVIAQNEQVFSGIFNG